MTIFALICVQSGAAKTFRYSESARFKGLTNNVAAGIVKREMVAPGVGGGGGYSTRV